MLLAEDVANAFLRETGVALTQRELPGRQMLIPADDRFGTFGIIVGRLRPDEPVVFETRSYPNDVLLVVWGKKTNVKKLDTILRRICT